MWQCAKKQKKIKKRTEKNQKELDRADAVRDCRLAELIRVQTMAKPRKTLVNRRDFLRNAAVGAAVLAAASEAPGSEPTPVRPPGTPPAMSQTAEVGTPSSAEVLTANRTGSDFMVDVIKSLGIEYICANPGSVRGF